MEGKHGVLGTKKTEHLNYMDAEVNFREFDRVREGSRDEGQQEIIVNQLHGECTCGWG